jgi:hypothetical protein
MKERVTGLEVILTDLLGREILKEEYKNPDQQLNLRYHLDDLPNGIYMMQFRSGDQRVMKKIILAR